MLLKYKENGKQIFSESLEREGEEENMPLCVIATWKCGRKPVLFFK